MKTVIVSGGFDPVHPGHVALFEEARKLGDRLVVILNNDNWLKKKKGYAFMNETQRAQIVAALKDVDYVYITEHVENTSDMSVCDDLRRIVKDMWNADEFLFCNGGDRKEDNVPEISVCKELGIEMAFNIGGGKIESSSELVKKAMAHVMFTRKIEHRPWGSFMLYAQGENYWIKKLQIKPGGRTSLQSHNGRKEVWVCINGEIIATKRDEEWHLGIGETMEIGPGDIHRISSKNGAELIEVGVGNCDENDIVRIEDDYGRV